LLSDIKSQVSSLEQDKRSLEDQTQQLKSQVSADGAFDEAIGPALVSGSLTGRKVLLISTNDKVSSDTIDALSTLVGSAGGTVSGTMHLQAGYTDPSKASALQSYVTGAGKPSGVTLPQTDDSKQLVAALLADVLMIPSDQTTPSNNSAAISSVLAGLSALDVLAQDSSSVTAADYAVLVTGDAFTGSSAGQRNAALVDLAAALDAAGSGAVVAGDSTAAGKNGLVGVLRDNPTVSAAVSTVDNVPTAAGQISTVLALSRERQGTSGKYGTGQDTQPVPPVPGATP